VFATVLVLAGGGVAFASDYHGSITPGGSAVAVTLSTAGDKGYLTWSGNAGDRVFLKATTGSLAGTGDVSVAIWKPDGSQLASSGFIGSSSVGFIDTQTLPTTGTYTVYINPYQTTTGTTTVTLYSVPADVAGSITPGGSAVAVTASTPGQNGALTWSGSAGDKVFLKASTGSLSGAGNRVVYVQIYKPDGTQLAYISNGVGSSSVGFIDTVSLPTTGTYTIKVDPQQDTTGTTTVTLSSPVDYSGSITPGGSSVAVPITTPGQNGTLTWTGTSGDRIFLKATTGTMSGAGTNLVYVQIYKPDGTQLAYITNGVSSSNRAGFIDTQTLPASGTYTIKIDPYQDTTGTVTVTLYSVPADVSNSITPGGSPVAVPITTPGQNGSLTWSGSAGDRVFLKATTGSMSGAGTNLVYAQIYKPDGTQLAYIPNGVSSSNSAGFIDTQTLPVSGTYTIKVDPYQDTTGTITLTLYSVPADVSGPIVLDGASVAVNASTPGQNGLLTFSGTAGQRVLVNATTGAFSGVGANALWVYLLKPDGSQLASTPLMVANYSASTGSATLPTTGTYTVKVDPYQDTTGTTTVTLETAFVSGQTPASAASSRGLANGAIPALIQCPQRCADPVNSENGDFSETVTDASVASYGPALVFTRTYDSSLAQAQAAAGTPGVLGYGWTDNWNMSLSVNSGLVTITQADGAQVTFKAPSGGACASPYVGSGASGTYCALPDTTASLTYNSTSGVYTFITHPYQSYSFNSSGQLTSETGPGGATLSLAYNTPAPGAGSCPSTASSCLTVTSASGRALVIASNASGLVTSVIDPLGRTWTYTYCAPPSSTCSANDLVSVTDPMSNVTSFTYDQGNSTSSLKHDLLTLTKPNGQPGGPNAGAKLTNVYNSSGLVSSQTDPSGYQTSFNYTNMNTSTGNGYTLVTDPDGNQTQYVYDSGILIQKTAGYGTSSASTRVYQPDSATLLDDAVIDPNGHKTSYSYDAAGNITAVTNPLGNTSTASYNSFDEKVCATLPLAASGCGSLSPPTAITAGTATVSPPASAPPKYVSYSLYDTAGNPIWTTTGDYQPGSSSASQSRTTYQLYSGQSVTLGSNTDSCAASPPASSLPCLAIDPNGVVTQLGYNTSGDLTSSATPDGNSGGELATTSYGYDGDGERTSMVAPDGNLSGATAANYPDPAVSG